MKYSAL